KPYQETMMNSKGRTENRGVYNTRGTTLKYSQLAPSTSTAKDFYPQKTYHGTMMNSKGRTENRGDCNTRGKTLKYSQLAPSTSTANDFYPQKTYQGTKSINSKGSTQRRDTDNYNYTRDKCYQGTNENSFPTPKRNRSELLSLFGGKSRPDKQGRSCNETITPPQQNFSTVSDSENVSYKKTLPTTNNPFSQAFDISLGDEDNFSDTSFQSLYNPKSATNATTSWLNGQPWHSDKTEVIDVNVCHDEYVVPEIDDVLLDYNHENNSNSNNFTSATSSVNTLPWKSNDPQVTRGCNVLDNKDFDEEMDDVVFDHDDYDGFGMFSTSSKTTRSLAGHKLGCKDRSFRNHNNISRSAPGTTVSRLNDSLSWESNKSRVCVGSNVLVNGPEFDPEFDNVVLDDDDEFATFSISSGKSTSVASGRQSFDHGNARRLTVDDDTLSPLQENATEREQLNNIPSTSRNFLPNRSLQHSSSRNNKFTSPLIVSVKNNPHASSSYQKDSGSSNIERTTCAVGSSIRPQSFSGELYFPSNAECCGSVTPTRQLIIPTKFTTAMDYKGILKSSLREHLNIILFELAQKYHGILCKADITSSDDTFSDQKENVKGPSCSHGPAKLRAVKKDGPNKGRHFYTCPGSGSNQCKFFQWADERQTASTTGTKKISLTSTDSIRVFFKSEGIYFYHNCLMERRSQPTKFFGKKYSKKGSNTDYGKKVMYIVLKYRDSSSLYTKDDIWIISKSINFEPRTTFVAKSMFYGPSSSGDLEIEPVSGYSPSNWRSGDTVHAIWACNAGTELSCIQNLDDYATLQHMPLLPYIMNGSRPSYSFQRTQRHSFSAPLSGVMDRNSLGISWQVTERETEEMIELHKLNTDQAAALRSCAKMFLSENEDRMECLPITLIHGVFGAGKSFLLAVVVLLMVRLFEIADASDEARTRPITWKILISSTTNVAVDRILLGLLDLGFDQFVRVGSVRKIAKPVLPFSIHSTGTESQELKELQGMLKTELTSSEKAYVRKSIEMHKLGENRKRLANVRVVGVTCAACTFAALERLKFPVLLLDECSQMTEPTSLLPMARFGCRKLVLVGDPKQLNPTIQGSEPSHESGLEQTLFDRLIKMDLKPILLRKQYRCHPVISSLSNRLFYNDRLLDGVNAEEREPLV
ncbi:ZGRF1 isoform X2, partial [Paramuricea clavata]